MLKSTLLLLVAITTLAQEPGLEAKMNQIQPGKSTLDDIVRIFGEPRRLHLNGQLFTRANLPGRYTVSYQGFAFYMHEGVVRNVEIGTPDYRYCGGIHVGSTVADMIKQMGEPKAVVKGVEQGEPRSGVLYEGSGEQPSFYPRFDLGVVFLLRGGKIDSIYLESPRRADAGGKLRELPRFDPNSNKPFQVDLRGADASALDLRDRINDLAQADFDTRTVWPAQERMPEGFDPARILEIGKNPGLGVRSLHKRGITGRGVAIALVDNPLLASHREYAGRLRFHEYINASPDGERNMHGSAVVSLAAGQTLGVAPGADIYYISSWAATAGELDFTPRAKAFERFLELNRTLPPEKRIRVISMSFGWTNRRGAAEMNAAAARAKEQGLLVVSPDIERVHGFKFHGLDRDPLADPDRFESYRPGAFWAKEFFNGNPKVRDFLAGRLLVPMDSRTGAGPGKDDEYAFYRQGGWSWAIPYVAGVYALAVQVDPGITPDRFWALAVKTGRTIPIDGAGRSYTLGPIIDPVALVQELGRRD